MAAGSLGVTCAAAGFCRRKPRLALPSAMQSPSPSRIGPVITARPLSMVPLAEQLT